MYKLGITSKVVYETLHEDLRKIIDRALQCSAVDFGLAHGYRSPEVQFEYYKKGRKKIEGEWIIVNKSKVITYVDGYKQLSMHNYQPARAFDFYVWIPGKKQLAYDDKHLIFVAANLLCVANKLYEEGEITHKIRWGGNWDSDGEIIYDQNFDDLPHVELIMNKNEN